MTDITMAITELAQVADLPEPPRNDQTHVAFFGVWNAGKSTLLKRLLVEVGRPVPDWLTVAAARETNFVGEVELDDGLVVLDAPGISAGVSLHAGEAATALRRADVVLVLLLPALLTAEADDVVRVLRGEHVHPAGWPWGADGLRVLVTQLDQGGFDLVADEAAFTDYARRKLDELQGIMADRNVVLDTEPAIVIADRNADVSDDRDDLELEDYGRGPWDGIAPLLAWLRNLPHEQVRTAAAARRLAEDATGAVAIRRRTAELAQRTIDRLQVEVATLDAQCAELHEQVDEARNDLQRALDDFAASVYGADADDRSEALEEQQRAVIEAWLERHRERFADLQVDATLDMDDLNGKRTADAWTVFESVVTDERFAEQANQTVQEIFGRSFEQLRDELDKTTDPTYWQDTSRVFRTEVQARVVRGVLVAGASVPLLLEVSSLVRAAVDDPTPEHERAATERRERVRQANEEAVEQAVSALTSYVTALTAPLTEDLKGKRGLIDQARQGISEQRQAADAIERRIEALRLAVGG